MDIETTLSTALAELLGVCPDAPDREVLVAAAREAWRRRQQNTVVGGVVLAALHAAPHHLSIRQIEALTGIPRETARRWGTPPDQVRSEDMPADGDQL